MSVGNPWSFFKNIYVISLKEATERRAAMKAHLDAFEGLSYTILDGVNGKKNPYLRKSYEDRGITNKYPCSDGLLGCLASHRMIWERVFAECNDAAPTWTLVMEDDALFHPAFTAAALAKYTAAIPSNALFLKFGYLATEAYTKSYVPINRYWTSFNGAQSFSTICYAVRSDLTPHLLKHQWTQAIDWLTIPQSYGAINLEEALGDDADYSGFRNYYNPYIKAVEPYHGVVAAAPSESQTFAAPAERTRYLVCFPAGGITDILCVISECLTHAEVYNRTLVIDTRKVEWFKDSIHDYIQFNHPRISVGNLDGLYDTLNALPTFPPEVKGDLHGFTATYKNTQFYYKETVPTRLDLSRDYEDPVIVFSNCGFSRNFTILKCMTFKEPILSVYRERRAKLPADYIAFHIRNTDYTSDVPAFLAEHDHRMVAPFFLASDHKETIDELKSRYGDTMITFSSIPHNTSTKGLHYAERTSDEHRAFIIDSYVDLLLLASAKEVYASCTNSGYGILAKRLCENKPVLQSLLTSAISTHL